ncbi:hypothetical protein [Halomarina rubra]|uniref:Uncharacterized protein n=1 Tax=Halomarina rubra TaxID=2071873 RepID=A0ABD6AZJ0_9EURY|nr:hypothetical protein [Halomarina rubra]
MDFEETHEALLALERTCRPDRVVSDGVHVWELVRFTVFRHVVSSLQQWGNPHTKAERDGRLYAARAGLLGRNLVRRNPFLAGEHDVLFWGHPRRKRLDDGLWWDIYCDPITDALDLDYLHVEAPHVNRHFTPAKTEALRYVDGIEIAGELGQLVGSTLDRPRFDAFAGVERAIEETFGVTVPVDRFARQHLAYRRTVRPLYHRLLARVDPEVVVLVVGYAGREPFIEVCKERDVTVVELQHGLIDRYQYGYSFPEWRTKETFPDHLFTFGEFWNEQAAFPVPDDHVHAVGYPHLERSVAEYADVERRRQVTFVSTGEVGHVLSKWAVDLQNRPDCDWSVVYKLHPGEADRWRSEYPWLVGSGVDVVDEEGRPLHRLFAESQAQVGVYSTALYEGIRFGLRTFLVDFPWMPSPPALTARETTTVDSAADLAAALESSGAPPDDSRFFARKPLETIERLLVDLQS